MNKSILAVAISSLIAGAVFNTSSNAQSQMSDQDYCRALVKAYTFGDMPHGVLQPDNATAVAIAQCQEGNAAPAIPVLERALRDAKVSMPTRG